jgi:hypothetical protein
MSGRSGYRKTNRRIRPTPRAGDANDQNATFEKKAAAVEPMAATVP